MKLPAKPLLFGLWFALAPALVSAAAPDAAVPTPIPAPNPATSSAATPPPAGPSIPGPSIAGTAPERAHPQTYLEFAIAGGPVMIPIGLCSIFWLAYLAERLISTRRGRVLPRPFQAATQALQGTGDWIRSRVDGLCRAHPCSASSVLRAALERLDRPREEIESGVNAAAQREIHRLRRNIRLFAIIASVAPLLGLLGTVTGMIQSFREVAIRGLGSGQDFAPGIYEALITTAGGLLVAIPSLLTYYWLTARVENYVHEMDALVVGVVDAYERGKNA